MGKMNVKMLTAELKCLALFIIGYFSRPTVCDENILYEEIGLKLNANA